MWKHVDNLWKHVDKFWKHVDMLWEHDSKTRILYCILYLVSCRALNRALPQ